MTETPILQYISSHLFCGPQAPRKLFGSLLPCSPGSTVYASHVEVDVLWNWEIPCKNYDRVAATTNYQTWKGEKDGPDIKDLKLFPSIPDLYYCIRIFSTNPSMALREWFREIKFFFFFDWVHLLITWSFIILNYNGPTLRFLKRLSSQWEERHHFLA